MSLLDVAGLQLAYGRVRCCSVSNLPSRRAKWRHCSVATAWARPVRCAPSAALPPAPVGILGGAIRFAGEGISGWMPARIARAGIALVPEGRQIFPNLSVRENLIAFAANRRRKVAEPWTLERVFTLFPRLAERQQNMGNQLSGGEQQMLAIGRALLTNPRLLILDEATEGLAPLVREEIWLCLARLREAGQTTLVVDKYVERLIRLADRHTIIERGRVVWRGTSVNSMPITAPGTAISGSDYSSATRAESSRSSSDGSPRFNSTSRRRWVALSISRLRQDRPR